MLSSSEQALGLVGKRLLGGAEQNGVFRALGIEVA